MKDYFGNELQIGDVVVFYAPGYRWFVTGKVIGFTPKQVRVKYTNHNDYEKTYLAYPKMYIKAPEGTTCP